MSSADLLHEYRWAIAVALIGLFLLSRYLMRRTHARRAARAAAAGGEQPMIGPQDYRRARKQFLLTLVMLFVIVVVAVLTHFR